MICGEHFSDIDFYKNSKTHRLKPSAVPKVFNNSSNANFSDENELRNTLEIDVSNDNTEHTEASEASVTLVGNDQNISSVQKNEWYGHYLKEKSERNIEVEALKQQIKRLENTNSVHRQHIKFLEQKLRRESKTKQSLQNLIVELHADQLLDAQHLDTLKVSIFLNFNIKQNMENN